MFWDSFSGGGWSQPGPVWCLDSTKGQLIIVITTEPNPSQHSTEHSHDLENPPVPYNTVQALVLTLLLSKLSPHVNANISFLYEGFESPSEATGIICFLSWLVVPQQLIKPWDKWEEHSILPAAGLWTWPLKSLAMTDKWKPLMLSHFLSPHSSHSTFKSSRTVVSEHFICNLLRPSLSTVSNFPALKWRYNCSLQTLLLLKN